MGRLDSMPRMNLGPVIEVREPADSKVLWHLMWNHVAGPGAACGAQSGCHTIALENVTCLKCLEVNESDK